MTRTATPGLPLPLVRRGKVRHVLHESTNRAGYIFVCHVDQYVSHLMRPICGMAPKIRSLVEAVRGGISRAHVIDGFEPHTLLLEVFTRKGRGTMIVRRHPSDGEGSG